MSESLYYSLVEKWNEFLYEEFIPSAETYTPDEALEKYDQLAHLFCREHEYSEKTEELAFHEKWYDTFADIYYQELESKGITIEEEHPI